MGIVSTPEYYYDWNYYECSLQSARCNYYDWNTTEYDYKSGRGPPLYKYSLWVLLLHQWASRIHFEYLATHTPVDDRWEDASNPGIMPVSKASFHAFLSFRCKRG